MAEAFTVVSVVASIVQLADFSTRVVSRLDEFYSIAKEVPKSFRDIKTELPLLAATLEQLKGAIDTVSEVDGYKKDLVRNIEGCREQITQLDAILKQTLPKVNDNWRIKGKKVIVSLHHDAKVKSITRTLRNYIGTLTLYYAAVPRLLHPLTGRVPLKESNTLYSNISVVPNSYMIRQWLSAPDPSANYQKALKLRQAGTGLWFLQSDAYVRWKMAATSHLWLYGIPGCGKTILSSTVLQDVLQYCQQDPGKIALYFFFDFSDVQKQDPKMMVCSLVCQLSQQSIKIPASLNDLFSTCESGQQQPSTHALLDSLQSMIQETPQVYIILDALDECNQRVELMGVLETMASWQFQNLHLLVASRRERDIEDSLAEFVNGHDRICLLGTSVDKDIKHYVRERLSTDKSLQKWQKDNAIRQDIEVTLQNGAHGMCVLSPKLHYIS